MVKPYVYNCHYEVNSHEKRQSRRFDNPAGATLWSFIMKWVARILLVFVLFTSVATAWDSDNCGQDLVFDSAGVTQSHNDGSSSGNLNDLCGHCGHLSSHLLGYIDNLQSTFPVLGHAWQGRPAIATPKPSTNFLFRPPRNFSVA